MDWLEALRRRLRAALARVSADEGARPPDAPLAVEQGEPEEGREAPSVPADFLPLPPLPPDEKSPVLLERGSHTLASNRVYRIAGSCGRLTIPPNAQRIRIEVHPQAGEEASVETVGFPVPSLSLPTPRCSDILVEGLLFRGAPPSPSSPEGRGYGVEVYGERIELRRVSVPRSFAGGGIYARGARHLRIVEPSIHVGGGEAGIRTAACHHVLILGGSVATEAKHSLRVHGIPEQGGSSFVAWIEVKTHRGWMIGYRPGMNQAGEKLDHILVRSCSTDPRTPDGKLPDRGTVVTAAPGTELRNLVFEDNILLSHESPQAAHELQRLIDGMVADPSWSVWGNRVV